MKTYPIFRTRKFYKSSNWIISFLILLICAPALGYAQRNYLFENISIPEGLSNSTIQYLFQDSNGFLWISTADGLNRYDGSNMKVFKNDPNDSTTIPNNNCFAITEDSDGFLWIGVSGNVIAKYHPQNESFEKYNIETGSVTNISEFYSALSDSKGNLWFGSTIHGMQKFNSSKNKFELVQLDSSNNSAQWGNIYGITELKNGNILAADYGSGIKIYNKKLNLFEPYYLKAIYSPNQVQVIYEDVSGNIWFGGIGKLIKYSPSHYTSENFDVFVHFKNPPFDDDATGIIEDADGYLWVVFYWQGIFRIDPKSKTIQKFNYGFDNSDISSRIVTAQILKDKYGVIWIGTRGGGLTKFDPLREPFNYSKLEKEELSGSGTSSVTVIANSKEDKEIIFGTSTKGLFSYKPENKKLDKLNVKFDPSAVPDGKINIQSLAVDDKGNKWFSYNNSGLYKLDNNKNISAISSIQEKRTSTYNINSMKVDVSGNIWIASMYGFEKYNPVKNEFSLLPTIMTKKMSDNLKQKITDIAKLREPISSILKVGEASNSEKKFTLSSDQKVLIIGVGEGRMVQGNYGMFDNGSLLTGAGKLIWSMNNLSRTFNDGGGFKNRITVKCLDLKKGDYKISFATDVGHSYGNWNVVPPPDSVWYGIQVLSLNESEFKSINEMNEKEINSNKYMPMEVGTCIEFSKKLNEVLWLGSLRNSFLKYDLSTRNFNQYNFDSENRFSPDNEITSIFEDRDGIIWISTAISLIKVRSDY